MTGCSNEVFSHGGDSPRRDFVLSWNFAGTVLRSLDATDALAS